MNNNLTLESLRNALAIAKQIQQLESRLAVIVGKGKAAPQLTVKKGPTKMSAAARAKIAAAQRARWARVKGKKPGPVLASKKAKGAISAAGRKRLSELMKARWAARKKAKAG